MINLRSITLSIGFMFFAITLTIPVIAEIDFDSTSATGWALHIGERFNYTLNSLNAVAASPDGYLLVGYHIRDGGWLVKIKQDGSILWQKAIVAPTSIGNFYSIESTSDGGFILGGDSYRDGEEMEDGWIVKLKPNGSIGWSKRYIGNWLETIQNVFETNDGKYISAGWAYDHTGYYGDGQNPWIQKVDKSGKIIWQKLYLGKQEHDGEEMTAICITSDNGLLLAGSTGGNNNADGVALRLDPMGEIVWQKRFAGISNDQINDTVQATDGGFLLAGSTKSFGSTLDPWVIKLDVNGKIIWQYRYKGSSDYMMNRIIVLSDGYLLTGTNIKTDSVILIKIGFDGKLVWQKDYGNSLDKIDDFVCVDALQTKDYGFFVTGTSTNWYGWGCPWVALLDSTGLLGRCTPNPLKLSATKTNVQVIISSYLAEDAYFVANSEIKDNIIVTSEKYTYSCR